MFNLADDLLGRVDYLPHSVDFLKVVLHLFFTVFFRRPAADEIIDVLELFAGELAVLLVLEFVVDGDQPLFSEYGGGESLRY